MVMEVCTRTSAPLGERRVRSLVRDPRAVASLGADFVYATVMFDHGWMPHDDGLLTPLRVAIRSGTR